MWPWEAVLAPACFLYRPDATPHLRWGPLPLSFSSRWGSLEGRAPGTSRHHPSIPIKPSCNTSVVRHKSALGWVGVQPLLYCLLRKKWHPSFSSLFSFSYNVSKLLLLLFTNLPWFYTGQYDSVLTFGIP